MSDALGNYATRDYVDHLPRDMVNHQIELNILSATIFVLQRKLFLGEFYIVSLE